MRLWLSLVPPLLALSLVCRAQQLPAFQDTVVVTATGEEQPADSVAAATTVIGRAEIDASGDATVAELLRRVAGATVLRSGQDGGVTSLFVRGTSSSHTLVLFDGVRLNSPFFGGYDWSMPLTAGIERVEAVRGPFSALYGGDAIGGVVQLVPERARAPELRGLIEGGASGWRRAEVDAATRLGSIDLLFSGGVREGSGTLANDDFAARSAMVDVSRRLPGGGRLGALVRVSQTRTEVPFSGALVTPNRSTAADEALVALPAKFTLGRGALDVTLDRVQRRVAYRDPDDPWGFTAADTDADSDGATATYRLTVSGQRLTAGGEWRRDRVTDTSTYGVSMDGRTITTRSLFVQDEVTIGPHFGVLAGARWDAASPWGGNVSPRVVASWHAARLRAWASYGKAFRAPSLGELYYPLSGNVGLAPERSRAAEVGLSLPAAGGRLRFEAAAFRNRVSDLIDFDFATYRYANISRAAQDGVELSGAARIAARSWLATSLTWLDARDGLGEALLRRPRLSGSATLTAPLTGAATGEASLVWVGRRDDLDPVTLARVAQPGFVTVDAALTMPLTASVSLRLRAENLADRSYEEVRGYPAPGRRFFVGAALTAY